MHYTGLTTHTMAHRPTTALVECITLQDAVYILRSELGNLRCWNSWLCDGNKQGSERGPSTLHGHTLKPCARVEGKPRYSLLEVRSFVQAIQAAIPGAKPEPVATEVYRIVPGRHWRLNNFKDGVATFH